MLQYMKTPNQRLLKIKKFICKISNVDQTIYSEQFGVMLIIIADNVKTDGYYFINF